jgi:hypothetical protein
MKKSSKNLLSKQDDHLQRMLTRGLKKGLQIEFLKSNFQIPILIVAGNGDWNNKTKRKKTDKRIEADGFL